MSGRQLNPETPCREPHSALERLELCAPAQPRTIAELRRQVVAYAAALGATEAVCNAVRLAVSEAVTNAVVHAYGDQERGYVTVEAFPDGSDELVVVIGDEGRGFLPSSASPGMGFGLGLMAQMADGGFQVASREGLAGTVVSLRFALARPETGN